MAKRSKKKYGNFLENFLRKTNFGAVKLMENAGVGLRIEECGEGCEGRAGFWGWQ